MKSVCKILQPVTRQILGWGIRDGVPPVQILGDMPPALIP